MFLNGKRWGLNFLCAVKNIHFEIMNLYVKYERLPKVVYFPNRLP